MPKKHLNQNLSSKLEALGVVCESGKWLVRDYDTEDWSLTDDPIVIEGIAPHQGVSEREYLQITSAYDFPSIMTRDALVKVFGERELFGGGSSVEEWVADWKENYHKGKNITLGRAKNIMEEDLEYFRKNGMIIRRWQYYRNLLAEAYSERGIEGCEEILERVLANRP